MTAAVSSRLRILGVEDEFLNRALLRASLSRSGDERFATAELTEATTLAEARAALAAREFDLVLLDRRLPDGDGFDLAREIQTVAGGQRPVVVALTADAVPATRAAAMDAGCDAILTKPYAPLELIALLASRLGTPSG